MLQIIEIGSPAFKEMLEKVIAETVRTCKAQLKDEDDFLTQEQAMELLKVKSKQKMKNIRESKMIKWKELGGVFLYSKKSMVEWMNK